MLVHSSTNSSQRLTQKRPSTVKAEKSPTACSKAADVYQGACDFVKDPSTKALGTVFAGVGAVLGRLAVPLGAAKIGASVGATLGPIGAIALGAAGLAAGAYTEFKNLRFEGVCPVGRMVGGMVGGLVGSVLGKTLDVLSLDITSEKMKKEIEGFSVKKLWNRVKTVGYTSHEPLSPEKVQDFKSKMQPGDVIVTSHDNFMDIEIPSMLIGAGGGWSHTAIYVGDGKVVEGLGNEHKKVVERSVEEAIGINHHVRVLRPKYEEGQADAAAQRAKEFVGKPWEMAFNLHSDEALGCLEVVYKAVKRSAPQMDIETHSLFGKKYLTHKVFNDSPDMEVVADTGSSMWYNYLSKFN